MLFGRKTKKRAKPRKKKAGALKFVNFPIAILTIISLLFISSFIYEIVFNEHENHQDISLEEILKSKSNSYEIKTGERIKVEIQNGCGQGKIAEMYQRFLRDKGFDVMDAKNASSFEHINSKIIIKSGNGEMASFLSNLMGINDSLITSSPNQDDIIHLILIVGKDFDLLESYDFVARYYPIF